MSIDTPRHPPGVRSPPGVAIAVGVMAVMGVYGFTTTLQKSLADRRDAVAAVRGEERDVRLASAIAPTPALVYALSDAPAQPITVARRAPTPLPEPEIAPEPVPVNLTAVAAAEPAPSMPVPVASAIDVAVNVSTTEAAPPAEPAVP